ALMEDGTTTSKRKEKSAISEHPLVKLTEIDGSGLLCSKPMTIRDPGGPCNESGFSCKSPKRASVAKRAANCKSSLHRDKRSKPRSLSLLNKKRSASKKSPAATGTRGKSAISDESLGKNERSKELLHDSNIANMNRIFLNKFNQITVIEIWEIGKKLGVRSTENDQTMLQ
ncbi:hypothetical protein Ancab_013351, partial [Ancistrocladus abbreviatus]